MPPLKLGKGVSVTGFIYFSIKGLVVNRWYLLALATNKAVADRGFTHIKHRGSNSYFGKLLGMDFPIKVTKATITDDAPPGIECHNGAASSNVLGLVDDYPDHEPDLDANHEDSASNASSAGDGGGIEHASVSDKHVNWGPVTFYYLTEVKSGRRKTSWRARCPFHQDGGDAAGTKCKRKLVFKGDDGRTEALLKLKSWIIAGRYCKRRKRPKNEAHVELRWSDIKILTDAEANAAFSDWLVDLTARGLGHGKWTEPDPGPSFFSPSGSSSSSSSSSSSTSSR